MSWEPTAASASRGGGTNLFSSQQSGLRKKKKRINRIVNIKKKKNMDLKTQTLV